MNKYLFFLRQFLTWKVKLLSFRNDNLRALRSLILASYFVVDVVVAIFFCTFSAPAGFSSSQQILKEECQKSQSLYRKWIIVIFVSKEKIKNIFETTMMRYFQRVNHLPSRRAEHPLVENGNRKIKIGHRNWETIRWWNP